jgi:hypothetical protein
MTTPNDINFYLASQDPEPAPAVVEPKTNYVAYALAALSVGALGLALYNETRRKPNPDVKVTVDSFANATEAYVDWKVKWWREAIQNGVDAGATIIRCEAHEQPDGTWLVSCEDNGRGMSRDTIENKLMAVGGTDKRSGGGGSVGGFGLAKNMLLFTWMSWEIRSRDSMIHGVGGSGSDFETIPMMQGTKITVRMPADKHTYDALAFAYIHRCDLPDVTFYVNGKPAYGKLQGKKLLKDESEFKLYFNPGKEKSHAIIVRTVGTQFRGSLFLFEVPLDSNVSGEVIVDLLVPSIKVLTDNRDGFNWSGGYSIKEKLMKFARELTIEGKAALRADRTLIKQAFRGEGKFRAEAPRREALATQAVESATSQKDIAKKLAGFVQEYGERDAEVSARPEMRRGGSGGGLSMPMANAEAVTAMLEAIKGQNNVDAAVKQVVWRPDFFLFNEISGFSVPKEFKPEFMSPRVVKLLSVWTDLCRFVMMQLGSSRTFGVGFMFSTTAGAAYLRDSGEDWLLLNPFSDVEKQKSMLRPSNDEDLQWLYAAATHECTHMADGIDEHGRDFAYALTHNMAKVNKGWRFVKRIEKATKMGAVAKVGTGKSAGLEPRRVEDENVSFAIKGLQDDWTSDELVRQLMNDRNMTEVEADRVVDEAHSHIRIVKYKLIEWGASQMVSGTAGYLIENMILRPTEYKNTHPKLPGLVAGVFGTRRQPRYSQIDDLVADMKDVAERSR